MSKVDKSFDLSHWKRNFYLFLTGQFLSGITSMIVQYSIIWYLTVLTGSATVISQATLLGMIPTIVLSPFVGPLIDRWNKKYLLIITDVVVAIFALVLAIVGFTSDGFPLWLVYVALFVRAVAQTFQMPTIQSILPTMVPESEITRVNGQLGMVQSANYIIAPALGAFLFTVMDMNFLILFDVLGAILGVGLLLFVAIPHLPSEGERVHILTDSVEGLKMLKSRKGLWHLALNNTLFMLIFMPAASLYPLMTINYFKGTAADAGIIEVLYAVGMLVGGSCIGLFGQWKNRMKPVFISYLIIAVTVLPSGLLPGNRMGFILFGVLNAITGLATPFFSTMLMAMVQQSYEPKFLGRVLGILNFLMSLAGPVGLLAAGPLADKLGVEKLFVIAGAGTFVCLIILLLSPSVRNYDLELQKELSQKEAEAASSSETTADSVES
ncbi:MFS transporter, DHA3 family, macrolide efflux protein [Enterococcus sp. AZ194]|uniref:MFS transporter n=1 Tax=Enterococcus sp. AZ194 TaxID=2774629 RepID=UPI003F28F32E